MVSLHPEFVFLAAQVQDCRAAPARKTAPRCSITIWRCRFVHNAGGRIGYKVMATAAAWAARLYRPGDDASSSGAEDILAYLEAVLRVYNQDSRRDNIHKQRIKILVNAIGLEEMRRRIDRREFAELKNDGGTLQLPQGELDHITAYFAPPEIRDQPVRTSIPRMPARLSPTGPKTNVRKHRKSPRLRHRHHHL